jgi:catechol 2,3-dioxygenase-like lactoylglutathione lyase family enzyme
MKLNHLNLTVTDVQEATTFLVKYFGMRDMGGNKGMGFLTDDDDEWGFVLTLTKAGEETQGRYPGTFHIGFFVESEVTVNEIHRRLKEDGYDVPTPTRNNHAYGFYVNAPGGFTVELGA